MPLGDAGGVFITICLILTTGEGGCDDVDSFLVVVVVVWKVEDLRLSGLTASGAVSTNS